MVTFVWTGLLTLYKPIIINIDLMEKEEFLEMLNEVDDVVYKYSNMTMDYCVDRGKWGAVIYRGISGSC